MEQAAPIPDSQVERRLIRGLKSKDWNIRARAEAELEAMGPAGFEFMLAIMRYEAEKRAKRKRAVRAVLSIYFGIAALVLTGWAIHGLGTGHWGHFPGGFNAGGLGLLGVATLTGMQKRGAQWLAKFEDPRAIGPILDAIAARDPSIRAALEEALEHLLPLMTEEHARELSKEHRATLRALLKEDSRPLLIAVLRALPVVADTKAISHVQMLQRRCADISYYGEVMVASNATLTALEELEERTRQKESLLRPAYSADQEVLLRAAASAQDTDPATLLRATTMNHA